MGLYCMKKTASAGESKQLWSITSLPGCFFTLTALRLYNKIAGDNQIFHIMSTFLKHGSFIFYSKINTIYVNPWMPKISFYV